MRPLRLDPVRRLTLFAAHPDDVEIACGGTLLTLAATPGLAVRYVLLTGDPDRQDEAVAAARRFLSGASIDFDLHRLPDGRLPAAWDAAKRIVEAAATGFDAELVLAPSPDDAHQDHRLLAELVTTAYRDHLCLRYEIPKWDGDLAPRQLYVPLDEALMRRKLELLHDCFPSQKSRDWWDDEVFRGIARLRGMECRSRYAEAYSVTKAVIAL